MAEQNSNGADRTPTADEGSFNAAPTALSKPTLLMVGAAIVFLIIFAILFFSFMRNPTGGASSSGSANTATRSNS